ncbi:ABC transporter permease [Actinopolymorpha alba]|uniref:ABC transporter permease n=1 Tax=Actinopolymorpha alba TaxID=533267 RepID=UPI0003722A62|nr:ABC transporter permease [Actinopolymorpha alba]
MTSENAMTDQIAATPLAPTTLSTDGAVPGYRARATLRIRTELRRQLRRRRTGLVFGLVVALPLVLVAAFRFGTQDTGGTASFGGLATFSAANFTVFTLSASATFLLVMIVALQCGDAVASEASWGTLRYLLAVPVPRARLLGVKLAVSLLTSTVALVLLTATALAVGWAAFGWGALRTPRGDDLGTSEALLRIGGMVGYLAGTLLLIAALAFWLSVSTDTPLAAVGGCVVVVIVANILNQVDALGSLRSVLPMHYADAWRGLFTEPVQLEGMAKGGVSALVYAAVFFACAWWTFLRKDVLS